MPDPILLGLLLLVVLLLALLLLRRAPADPGLALLQAAQERQGGQLAALPAELGERLSAPILDQTKALNAALREQAQAAAALRAELLAATAQMKLDAQALRVALAEGQARAQQEFAAEMVAARELIDRKADEGHAQVEAKLSEMREANDKRLADIQRSVNEQLQSAVEKQMAESFNRVIDQFAAVQKAMGDVQAVTAQIGDIKRLFGNVKTRGGWGETQVKALLDDILPEGTYEVNARLRDGSADTVEFAVVMPSPGEARVLLPVDAKFPVEDYERLLNAWDAADPVAEAQARKALEQRIRGEARKIAEKYICPPRTVEFGVMYLPTEGLYAEVARIPGLIDEVGRHQRVLILGPSLLPALLRTIQLGHVTLALSRNAESVRDLLAATKGEMGKINSVLTKLGTQVGTVTRTIGEAQSRTRQIEKKLKSVEAMPGDQSAPLLGLEDTAYAEDGE
jgi:DNA recombination protein RmuC